MLKPLTVLKPLIKLRRINFVLLLFCLCLSATASADIRYISDVTYVPLRSGPGGDYRIIHYGLKSGLKLNLLEMPDEGDWANVQTPSGLEGWIKKQYLLAKPIARDRLQKAQKDLIAAKQKLENLRLEHIRLNEAHTALLKNAQAKLEETAKLEGQYKNLKQISDNAVNLDKQNKSLLTKNDLLQTELDSKNAIVDSLSSQRTVEKWLVGAGLLLSGMVLMLIIPIIKPKKQYSEWA